MAHILESHYDQLERKRTQARLSFLRAAVEDATYELYRGGLSYREGEALAREITCVRAEITTLERDLRQNGDSRIPPGGSPPPFDSGDEGSSEPPERLLFRLSGMIEMFARGSPSERR